jgi:flagellar FliL protein
MADKKKKEKGKPKDEKDVKDVADEGAEGEEKPEGEGGEEQLDLDGGKKKGLKPIIIIVGAVLLLVGAGAGVYFSGMLDGLLGKNTEEHAAEGGEHGAEAKAEGEHGEKKAEKKKAKKKGGGGGHGGGDEEGGESLFMALPDLIVNLSTSQGQPRYLKLKVQLELNDPADQPAVAAIAPRVIDHFQTYLRELRVSDLRGSAGIYRLRQELLARVNAAAAPIEVKDVLFQEILIQ